MQKQKWGPLRTRLALITTAAAALVSIPSLLRDNASRDPTEALKQLIALAATAPSQALAAPVQVFNALTAPQQKQLVQAIVVLDQSPPMPDLEGAIKKALGYIASADKSIRLSPPKVYYLFHTSHYSIESANPGSYNIY